MNGNAVRRFTALSAIATALVAVAPARAQQPCPPVLCLDQCGSTVQATSCAIPAPGEFEGFGAVTQGGAGGDICRVTTTADSGSGSLRQCITNRVQQNGDFLPRIIEFDVAGDIVLQSDLRISTPYLTIDGSTAPSPGITIKKVGLEDGEMRVNTTATTSGHDIIITHLRFDGGWDQVTTNNSNNSSTLNLDGEDNPGGIYNIVLDHLTFLHATDSSPDMWGEVNNVTISWSLFYDNYHPMTISHSGGTQARHGISLHHNVFARNHERSPQIRGNVRNFDYVNNIVYNWGLFSGGGYGVRIRDINGVYPTEMNFVSNFMSSSNRSSWGIVYDDSPGGATYPGAIWTAGNVLPSANTDGYATRSGAVAIPANAQVTTYPVEDLAAQVLPGVGMRFRTPQEDALIREIEDTMNAQLP